MTSLVEKINAREVDAVLSLGSLVGESADVLSALANVPHVNLSSNIGTLAQLASIVVPVATVAETNGTFTNVQGMQQTFQRAVQAPGSIVSAWETLVAIALATGNDIQLKRLPDVRAAMPALTATSATVADAASAPAE
jgi:NADH dehydrogenase/NADH:ubiquinone oxidoreductase subunit G